ncbi:alanine racemase [Muriicola jejuensis]|uniref:Alanine racemase n=1 Tax=Muriicola jejuensis TaxID=504488 RepID=A0A6P0UA61_9FLAO|nr:alanine racemase [Muriicola jejuensis]NER10084.1 alanine racemase [Muriicola jejuensis]SMP03097.1 alanine racemase [Muriicola jejuensis]
MPDIHETVLEIDLGALEHNYRFLRSRIKPSTKFMAVVKASGYGSDALAIANKLVSLGIDALAVAYASEGIALREGGIRCPILVLHPQVGNFDEIIAYEMEPSLYSARILKGFHQAARKAAQEGYPVHLKFNTGLNRLGFWETDVRFIKEEIDASGALKIKGILSHLGASEDLDEKEFTQRQIALFSKIVEEVERSLGPIPLKHLLNTSGILNYPEAQWDMVRSGIGVYGYGNDPRFDPELRPVVSLKTVISQLHRIEPGETVGYNRAYRADGHRTTATLPLGHADGIGRQYGQGKASVLVQGNQAPIIGNVCMDMLMIDVTGIDCKEGDEVILFGEGQSADQFASYAGTISYELLTGIATRVKRIYKDPNPL